jgi:hypothetical protein
MAKILAVHGIFHKYDGPNVIHQEWFPALNDGLGFVGGNKLAPDDLAIAFYGDLFRKRITKGISEPVYEAIDVVDPYEQALLKAWSQEAQTVEPKLQREAKGILMPHSLQSTLLTLCRSRFFATAAETTIIARLKEVSGYMHDEAVFKDVQARVEEAVKPDTKILIGHSLGSVVAYEALCAHPEWPIETLITLGSPLVSYQPSFYIF